MIVSTKSHWVGRPCYTIRQEPNLFSPRLLLLPERTFENFKGLPICIHLYRYGWDVWLWLVAASVKSLGSAMSRQDALCVDDMNIHVKICICSGPVINRNFWPVARFSRNTHTNWARPGQGYGTGQVKLDKGKVGLGRSGVQLHSVGQTVRDQGTQLTSKSRVL